MILVLFNPAFAGAFGIEMGTPISSLPGATPAPGATGVYVVPKPPKPYSEFEGYLAVATESLGVCKVVGIGKTHEGDLGGSEIRGVIDTLLGVLKPKYGQPQEFDFLQAGSVWKDAGEFSMGLFLKQRTLAYIWSTVSVDDIASVLLEAGGPSATSTDVTLSYEFTNFKLYADAQQKADTAGL